MCLNACDIICVVVNYKGNNYDYISWLKQRWLR